MKITAPASLFTYRGLSLDDYQFPIGSDFEALVESIKRDGQREPVTVDYNLGIVNGLYRALACKMLDIRIHYKLTTDVPDDFTISPAMELAVFDYLKRIGSYDSSIDTCELIRVGHYLSVHSLNLDQAQEKFSITYTYYNLSKAAYKKYADLTKPLSPIEEFMQL